MGRWRAPRGVDGDAVLTPAEMRAVDTHAIEVLGVPGLALMENAARHIAVEAAALAPAGGRIGIVCGRGHNGGDGLAAARHLHSWGHAVEIILLGDPDGLRADAAVHLQVAQRLGWPLWVAEDLSAIAHLPAPRHFSLLVDALFGTGLSGPVSGPARELIAWINGHGVPVVAVDVPSGLCGLTGQVLGAAVEATCTVTFAASKTGHWLYPGPAYAGRLHVVDIGIPRGVVEALGGRRVVLGDAHLAAATAPAQHNTHKGRQGHVLVLAGSLGRTGAARLAAEAALRAGAGLVTAAVDQPAFAGVSATAWEMMTVVGTDAGEPLAAEVARLRAEGERCAAVVVGPGLAPTPRTGETLAALLPQIGRPAVVDAEALNQLTASPALLGQGGPRVLTPHPGEAARLLGWAVADVQRDRLGALDALVAATKAVVVLKGAHTWVGAPDGRRGVCPDGNPGMATAGSGDVLAGVVGALLARGLTPWAAAVAGVVWHARAGDAARAATSTHAVMARALIEHLPAVEQSGC